MSDHSATKFEAAIRVAFDGAIKAVGVGNFKRCSLFLSNERDHSQSKKAA